MNRILAPIDFSDITDAVIERAAALANAFGGRIWLMHVVPPDPEFVGYEAGPQSVRDAQAERYREEHRQLQERAEQLTASGVSCESLLVRGVVVDEVLDHATRLNIDTIVLGSHGHGALYQLLLGSSTEAILRQSPCPVCIIPATRPQS